MTMKPSYVGVSLNTNGRWILRKFPAVSPETDTVQLYSIDGYFEPVFSASVKLVSSLLSLLERDLLCHHAREMNSRKRERVLQ
jgi:hypothetical protein